MAVVHFGVVAVLDVVIHVVISDSECKVFGNDGLNLVAIVFRW